MLKLRMLLLLRWQWLSRVSQVMETSGAAVCWLSLVCLPIRFCPPHLRPHAASHCPPTSSCTMTLAEAHVEKSSEKEVCNVLTRWEEMREENGLEMSNGLFTPESSWLERKRYIDPPTSPEVSSGVFWNLTMYNSWLTWNHPRMK